MTGQYLQTFQCLFIPDLQSKRKKREKMSVGMGLSGSEGCCETERTCDFAMGADLGHAKNGLFL